MNKKIAEWCGFKPIKAVSYCAPHWRKPGKWERCDLPDFTTSLDTCFQYIVPKLNQAQYYECLRSIFVKTDKPALALCRAVEKLIDE